jgi:hypothetical protein
MRSSLPFGAVPTAASPRRWLLPDWYVAVLVLTILYTGAIFFYYLTGAGGVSVNGAKAIDFKREFDFQLYQLDDQRAFAVGADGDVNLVRFGKGPLIMYPCGCYEEQGNVVQGLVLGAEAFWKGDWVYSKFPENGYPAAINLKTAQLITPTDLDDDRDLETPPQVYRQNGLDFDPHNALTPARIAQECPALFTDKESCDTLLLAAYAILAILVLFAPFALLSQRKKNRLLEAGTRAPGGGPAS